MRYLDGKERRATSEGYLSFLVNKTGYFVVPAVLLFFRITGQQNKNFVDLSGGETRILCILTTAPRLHR